MDALNLIRTRHSCRHFSSKPVEREKVEQVVEAGRFAPSGGDNQYTHFLVIRDHAVLEKIARVACAEFAKMEVTPTTYRSLANCIRFSKLGKCTFHYNAPVLIVTANREGYGNHGRLRLRRGKHASHGQCPGFGRLLYQPAELAP